MKLYIADIRQVSKSKYEELLPDVSRERYERLLQYHQEPDRVRGLVGELLILRAVKEELGLEKNQISFDSVERGKPVLHGYPEFHFNVSHSKDLVLCAIGSSPVGVDVQSLIIKPDRLISKCLTEKEQAAMHNLPDGKKSEYMTTLWCRKESYMKMTGKGLALPMNLIEFDLLSNTVALLYDAGMIQEVCYLTEPQISDEYKASICMRTKEDLVVIRDINF